MMRILNDPDFHGGTPVNKILVTIAAIVALTAGLSWSTRAKAPDFAGRFETACVEAIKERLKAPSAFRLIKISRAPDKPLTLEWLAEHRSKDWSKSEDENERDLGESLKDIAERQVANGHKIAAAVISYDARNSFGTPLRGQNLCELPYNPKGEGFPEREIRIDGQTTFQWMLSRL